MVTNDLAKGFKEAYEGLKKGPSRGTIITLAVAVSLVLIVVLFRYFWLSSVTSESERWTLIDEVVFPEQFKSVSENDKLKDTNQARVLSFMEARRKLAQGVRDMGSADTGTRKRARKSVDEARQIYAELKAKASSLSPQLHQEAIWGEAKAYEVLGSANDLAEARKLYEKLQKDYPTSALGKDARRQIERLDDPDTKKDLQAIANELDTKN